MSHRTESDITAHEMLPDGVANQLGDVISINVVVVTGAASVVDVDALDDDEVVVDEDPDPPAQAESANARRTAAEANSTRRESAVIIRLLDTQA
ncbi:MAG: hypothetical protein WCJ88_02040 [Actinomycetes bacterium]